RETNITSSCLVNQLDITDLPWRTEDKNGEKGIISHIWVDRLLMAIGNCIKKLGLKPNLNTTYIVTNQFSLHVNYHIWKTKQSIPKRVERNLISKRKKMEMQFMCYTIIDIMEENRTTNDVPCMLKAQFQIY
ncbi:hypothetical protein ACJX0J_012482, partial [Zea mays]